MPRRHVPAGRRVLRIDLAVEIVEAQTGIERQPAQRPLILCIEPQVVLNAGPDHDGRRNQNRLERDAVVHPKHGIVAVRAGARPVTFIVLKADLEGVRSGDVRERRGRAHHVPAVLRISKDVWTCRACGFASGDFEHGPCVGVILQARGRVIEELMMDKTLRSGFDQQPVRDRRAPFGIPEIEERVMLVDRSFGRDEGTQAEIGDFPTLIVDVETELVPRRRLPSEPPSGSLEMLEIDRLSRRVPLEKAVRDQAVCAPVAVTGVEPQLVALDRSAQSEADVPNLVDPVGRRQTLLFEPRRQIVAAHFRVRKAAVDGRCEGVASLLGDDIGADATRLTFSGNSAGFEYELLNVGVRRNPRGVAGCEVIETDAVHVLGKIVRVRTVRRDASRGFARASALILKGVIAGGADHHAGQERGRRLHVVASRNRIQYLAPYDEPLSRVLDIDDRRFTRHGDRLLQRPDHQVGVYRQRHPG